MDDDLEKGVIHISEVTETKRTLIAFLRPEVIDWVRQNYLPIRESLVNAKLAIIRVDYLGAKPNPKDWARRFIPFDRNKLRREVKEAAQKVLVGNSSFTNFVSSLRHT